MGDLAKPAASDTPTLARPDFQSLPPVAGPTPDGRAERWDGSGVPLSRHPELAPLADDRCVACASHDTLVIAVRVEGDLVEKDTEYELVCRACGRFSHYAIWR